MQLRNATAQAWQVRNRPRVTVSTLPLLANGWLMPRLKGFLVRHPEVDVHVQYARYRNYSADAADLSLRFGAGDWPGYTSEKILPGAAYPVCSAALLRRHSPVRTPADLLHLPLIHDGSPEQWTRWLTESGVAVDSPLRGIVCEDGMLTRAAILNEMGVALTRPLLLKRDIDAGSMVVLSDRGIENGEDYYLCHRTGSDMPPAVRQLASWLKQRHEGPD
jgi:DNA-binding transcriptional LysR family regulator